MKNIKDYNIIPKTEANKIKVLIVDDRSFVRRFISKSLEEYPQIAVIGMADSGENAIAQVETLQPNVVLIDLEMPGMDGVTATKIITQRFPNCKILVLSSHEDSEYLQNSLQAGAKGYIIKGSPAEELCNAIQSVHLGYVQLSSGLLEKVFAPEVEIVPDTPDTAITEEIVTDNWSEATRETINTIPRVSLRAILYILLILAGVLIPWTIFAKVDEIGTARGRLEPKGKVIRLDAPVSGTVITINSKEGEQVKKGDSLIQLESDLVESQLEQQKQKLQGQQNQLNQLNLLKNQQLLTLNTQQQQSQAQQFEKQALIDRARQTLDSSQVSRKLQLSEKAALIEQAKGAMTASESAHSTAQIRDRAAQEKVPRYREAYEQGALSKDLLAEAEQTAQENRESLNQTNAEIAQSRSQYAEQKQGYKNLSQQIDAEIERAKIDLQEQQQGYQSLIQTNKLTLLKSQEELKNTERQIVTLQGEIAQINSLIDGLNYQLKQRVLYAPVTGTVFQLPIQKPGAVVQPGQMIAQIAPQDSPLVFRGRMSSSESGFLAKGLPVKLKFDAYPFQDYGIIPGRLTWISPDSRNSQNRNTSSNETEQPGEFYEVEITLEKNAIELSDKTILLTPGQTATAEIIIRQRRLADIFLAPFKSLQKGGIQL